MDYAAILETVIQFMPSDECEQPTRKMPKL
jgi:hypothetical protein